MPDLDVARIAEERKLKEKIPPLTRKEIDVIVEAFKGNPATATDRDLAIVAADGAYSAALPAWVLVRLLQLERRVAQLEKERK
jgi:hypothetical protein